MSIFKRMLSSVGIGSAKVDTVLHGERFTPGEHMNATVYIKGGGIEQQIDDVYFSLHCNYTREYERDGESVEETHVAVLDKFRLHEPFTLAPGKELEIPVDIHLPLETPLTYGRTKVWVQTGLDIKRAVDPGDRDYVDVVAGPLVGPLFDSLLDLGFDMVNADCEAASKRFGNHMPFIQEFEFKPRQGEFRGRLDELEVVCFLREHYVDVYFEIDRRARGLSGLISEWLDTDEKHVRFKLTEHDLGHLTDNIYHMIDRWS